MFLAKQFGGVRFIYNYLLSRSNEIYEKEKKTIHINDLKKEIPQLKSAKKWLKEINSQSLQEAALNLGKSRDRFFKKQNGRPRFKRKNSKQSCTIPQHFSIKKSKMDNKFLYIPKLKSGIKIKMHRELVGESKRIVITKTYTGKYFASITYDVKREDIPKPKTMGEARGKIGIDLGITSFVTTSNGEKILYPRFMKTSLKKMARASKSLARKKKGSNNREKSKLKLAKIHEKIANKRSSFVHETSFALINENQVIYAEDLHVKGMMRNHCLARSIADTAMGEFIRQIKYKAEWRGRTFVQIGRFEPSSKMCNTCKTVNKELKLQHRTWRCKLCGSMHDRDINAAINILKIGQNVSRTRASLGKGRPEVKPVERSTKVFSSNKKKQVGSMKQEPISNLRIGMHGNLLP
ncbi:transposase [Candidatus Babeliales bacterium]|nr:transposase [Candidatus Babeliales bacterium]